MTGEASDSGMRASTGLGRHSPSIVTPRFFTDLRTWRPVVFSSPNKRVPASFSRASPDRLEAPFYLLSHGG